jgi:hypothetical protein
MGLFEPAWMTDDTNKLFKALRSVEKIKDQETLAKAAQSAPRHEIRVAAMDKLTDQEILADLAKNVALSDVRRQAVVKLTDQALVAEVAKNDENIAVRTAAVERLTNQADLADIAKSEKDKDILILVISLLTDQDALAYMTKNYEDWKIRFNAALKLTDQALAQEVYSDVIKYENIGDAKRKQLVEVLTDQKALAYVAKLPSTLSKKIWALRETALGKITDKSVLSDIAKNAEEESVRRAAAEKLR